MSTIFQQYSHYYDLLNTDKDYGRETDYVLALAQRFASSQPLMEVLNLGCGTGCHDLHLAGQGYQVTGVDRSETMLTIATRAVAESAIHPAPSFVLGNITSLRLDKKFDLVLSLFHVVSYHTTNEELQNAMHTAAAHLEPGGLFIFDFWYGPAVLHEKPTVRVKRVEDETFALRRITEPVLHDNTNTVEVNFEIDITTKTDGSRQTMRETHIMRYLFLPEITALLHHANLTLLNVEEWLTGHVPSLNSWNVCCIAKKNPSRK
ncbi:MAG: class I SAM-dependent methyltransferase [Proteobacteria bacterium]|nr:class I SAM-dependent methyltransferase [Desulfobulbaceae bacterium]MBU4151636.1 class I SAM-dependent methyltransferase [Pseudomonadota bacterium]MDP2105519.1 class I SAM-dependent methyltransferase [Desulfobulbaceae bacterium]